MKRKAIFAICLGLAVSLPLGVAAEGGALGESTSIKLLDHVMVDTQRRSMKLVSEAMGNHIVVMNFVYTDCKTVCPVSTGIMRAVYKQIEDSQELKDSVRMISLTLNPALDTPKKMRDFAEKYGFNEDNWLWLTGSSNAVNEALLGLRAYAADVTEHSSVILVGNPTDNHWTSFYQFPNADLIINRIHDYVDQQKAS